MRSRPMFIISFSSVHYYLFSQGLPAVPGLPLRHELYLFSLSSASITKGREFDLRGFSPVRQRLEIALEQYLLQPDAVSEAPLHAPVLDLVLDLAPCPLPTPLDIQVSHAKSRLTSRTSISAISNQTSSL